MPTLDTLIAERLPREVGGSPSLQILKSQLDPVLSIPLRGTLPWARGLAGPRRCQPAPASCEHWDSGEREKNWWWALCCEHDRVARFLRANRSVQVFMHQLQQRVEEKRCDGTSLLEAQIQTRLPGSRCTASIKLPPCILLPTQSCLLLPLLADKQNASTRYAKRRCVMLIKLFS